MSQRRLFQAEKRGYNSTAMHWLAKHSATVNSQGQRQRQRLCQI